MVSVEAVQSRGKDNSENGELGFEWKGLIIRLAMFSCPRLNLM